MSHSLKDKDNYRLPPDIISSINYIERERREINSEDTDYSRHIPLFIVAFFVVLLVFIGLKAIAGGGLFDLFIGLWVGLAPFYVVYLVAKRKKQNTSLQVHHDIYVRDVILPLLESLSPQLRYERSGSILPYCEADIKHWFSSSGSIRKAEDLVEGEINGVSIRFGEIEKLADSEYEKFLCFVADFNKVLNATTLLDPKSVALRQVFSPKRKALKDVKSIQLDNPTFNKQYQVYTDNDIEARYILTPRFMESILATRGSLCGYYLFKENKILFVGNVSVNHAQVDLFDIDAETNIYEQTLQTAKALKHLLGLVEAFNLDSLIWK